MNSCPSRSLLLTLLVLVVGILLSAPAASAAVDGESYIVVLEDTVAAPGSVARAHAEKFGGDVGFVYRYALTGYSIELPEAALEAIRRDPRVKYATHDGFAEPVEDVELETEDHEGPEVMEATIPTGISRTFAASNKALDIDGVDDVRADVDVAVLDTGIDPSQPDLNVVARTNCTAGGETCTDNSGTDGHSHGTHVAGTIAALDNGIGVVGIAPGARLWAVKVLKDSGGGSWSSIIAGIDWVTGHSADIEVANMSLGGGGTIKALIEALEGSTEAGVVYAVAAGNQNANSVGFTPANIGFLITVSAIADYDGQPGGKASPTCSNLGLDDQRASFSNFGGGVDITAPGVCILSTMPSSSYGLKSGTSMATPHVAGAAALLAVHDDPSDKEDVEAIRGTLVATGNYNWTDTSGDGIKEPLLDVHSESVYFLNESPDVNTGPIKYIGTGSETKTMATGTIDPNGLATTYQFEYVIAAKYKPEAENPYAEGKKVPVPAASIGSGSKSTDIAVEELLTGLEPNTTYHYRLVAENSKGISAGGDQTFVSLPACKGAEQKCEWSIQTTPNPQPETKNDLEDVSCASSTMCMAVGNDSYRKVGFSQFWNGSEWKMANSFSGEIAAISCPTTTWCMTVARVDGKGWQLKWVEFIGGSWSASAKNAPTPEGGTAVRLNDVSCTSESACTAVGRYSAGGDKPYVARWNGTSWSLQSAPSPTEGNASEALLSVSCASASFCMAVGKAASKPFVERWNGSEWAIQSAPNPAGAVDASLLEVSCPTTSDCMAVGSFRETFLGPSKTLSERWNGSSWSVVATPAPGKEGSAVLSGVSCISASSCIAVGSIIDSVLSPKEQVTLAESWNGTSWSVQSSPNPEGKKFSSFGSVSCASAVACTAVGSARPEWGDQDRVTLAERYG